MRLQTRLVISSKFGSLAHASLICDVCNEKRTARVGDQAGFFAVAESLHASAVVGKKSLFLHKSTTQQFHMWSSMLLNNKTESMSPSMTHIRVVELVSK